MLVRVAPSSPSPRIAIARPAGSGTSVVGPGSVIAGVPAKLLRELGHPPVPVGTTVHDVQVVEDFPVVGNDMWLSVVCTPTRTLRIEGDIAAPEGIDW